MAFSGRWFSPANFARLYVASMSPRPMICRQCRHVANVACQCRLNVAMSPMSPVSPMSPPMSPQCRLCRLSNVASMSPEPMSPMSPMSPANVASMSPMSPGQCRLARSTGSLTAGSQHKAGLGLAGLSPAWLARAARIQAHAMPHMAWHELGQASTASGGTCRYRDLVNVDEEEDAQISLT